MLRFSSSFHAIALPLIAASVAIPAIPASAQPKDEDIVVTAQHRDQYKEGTALEKKGLAALEEAQGDLDSANKRVNSAREKRDDAFSAIAKLRREFSDQLSEVPSFDSGDDAHDWAEKLEHTGDRWESKDSTRKSAQKTLDKAIDRRSSAAKDLAKAQDTADRGHQMMARAVRASNLTASNN